MMFCHATKGEILAKLTASATLNLNAYARNNLMQVTSVRRALLAVVLSVATSSFAWCADATARQSVEFRHVGDDSLSQKLAAAVEAAFKRSRDFRLSTTGEPGALVVTITRNVEWELVGKKTRATYNVRFSSAKGHDIATETGSCWESALARCAAQIVTDAKTAAQKGSGSAVHR